MNKDDFILKLKKNLKQLPKDEVNNVTQYYEEYFQDSHKTDEEVIAEIGSPSSIACQILNDYGITTEKIYKKNSIKDKIIIAVLLVLAAPIGIPLILAAAAVIFGVSIALISGILAILFSVCIIVFSGLIFMVAGIGVAFSSPIVAAFYIGAGLVIIGMSILLSSLLKILLPKSKKGIKNFIEKVSFKIKSRRERRLKWIKKSN